jgi:hypothetical protein
MVSMGNFGRRKDIVKSFKCKGIGSVNCGGARAMREGMKVVRARWNGGMRCTSECVYFDEVNNVCMGARVCRDHNRFLFCSQSDGLSSADQLSFGRSFFAPCARATESGEERKDGALRRH